MLNFRKVFVALALLSSIFSATASFAETNAPSWYTGDSALYADFVSACEIVKNKCQNIEYSCDIKSMEEFGKTYITVQMCLTNLTQKNIKPSEDRRNNFKTQQPVPVASVRG